ncbi:MAG: hypothetical protein ACO1NM_00010 [Sphingobium phenoxybenzoativorans]
MRALVRRGGLVIAAAMAMVPATQGIAARDKPTDALMTGSFRAAAGQARAALDAGDVNGAAAQVSALLPSNPLENYTAAALRMEVAAKRGDPQAKRKALTDILESKAVPAGQEPYLRYLAAYYSYYLGVFNDALAQINYARQMGYNTTESTVLLADILIKSGKPTEGLALVDQAMEQQKAAGKPVPATWYDRAIGVAYKQGSWGEVAKWCERKLRAYPSEGNWRSCLANYLTAPGVDPQLQLDLYRLQAATGAMASERDYRSYSTLASAAGYDAEAKAVIDAGRTAGKLDATEVETTKLLKTVKVKAPKTIAALPAQVKKAKAASNGMPALEVGDVYFSLGQYPQAVEQYRLALSKGGVDPTRVNGRLGVALARSGDLPGGKAALAQAGGNWTNVAGFWNVWVDQQAQAKTGLTPAMSAPTS